MVKVRIPSSATPGAIVDYASSSKTGTVVALFAVIVVLDLVRRGWPGTPGAFTAQRALSLFGIAFAFVLFANFAPALATALLWGIVLLMALNTAPAIAEWFRKINAGLGMPPVAPPIAHGPLPTAT